MLKLQLYIEGEAVELFDDESVSLTQTIQNVKDISKIFTDFSKTFNVPASKINNRFFKHFYNPDIIGFDSGTKKSAEIYLNHQLFKKGKIKLEGVTLKGNKADAYKITFFGDVVNMKDLLSDDKIGSLDLLYDFRFDYNSTNVINYMQDGLDVTIGGVTYPDAVIIPLISHTQRLYYDSSTPAAQSGNLHYRPDTIQGVRYEQLKPAIRVYALLKAVEQKYGLRFSADFFNASNEPFYNLYLWLHRKEGGVLEEDKIRAQATGFKAVLTGSNKDKDYWRNRIFNDRWIFDRMPSSKDRQKYKVAVSTESTNYNIIIERDGEEHQRFDNQSGNQTFGEWGEKTDYPAGTYRIFFESENSAEFSLDIRVNRQDDQLIAYDNISASFIGTATVAAEAEFDVALQTPDIKVIDIITGLFKMFNLTAYQDEKGEIIVKPLNDFYEQSKNIYDITSYIDQNASTVDSLLPYKKIRFTYKGTKSFFSESHKELFGSVWGEENYESTTSIEGDIFNLELPFEHHKFERLRDFNQIATTVQWGWAVDIKQEPYLGEPFLFYAKKITSGTQIGVLKTTSDREVLTSYYIPSNSLDITDSQNINFKAEVNEYDGNVFPQTLYKTYYDSYISDTFNSGRRLTKYKAYLPLRILLNFTLADKFIVFDKVYKINTITTDLSTGLSSLELINEIGKFELLDDTKDFADTADKAWITVDTNKVTVDWIGTI